MSGRQSASIRLGSHLDQPIHRGRRIPRRIRCVGHVGSAAPHFQAKIARLFG
jgi:hypothetical protein